MRILCFGDSNTYGYDPRGFLGDRYNSDDRWVDLLAKQTVHKIINAGINGRAIPRDPLLLTAQKDADTLLVMLGTNDLLQGATAGEAAARMGSFLISTRPHFTQIVLIAPPPMTRGAWVPDTGLVVQSVRLAEEYRLLAESLGIPFMDTRDWNIDLAFDGVHFTEAGHHVFAERLQHVLGL